MVKTWMKGRLQCNYTLTLWLSNIRLNSRHPFDMIIWGSMSRRVIFLTCTVRAMYKAISAPTVNPKTYRCRAAENIKILVRVLHRAQRCYLSLYYIIQCSCCYSSTVVTFSGFPEHWIIFNQVCIKTITWWFAWFHSIKSKGMCGNNCKI